MKHSEAFLKAMHLYHEAYVTWHVRAHNARNSDLTHALLIQATDLLPSDPHLWIQRGYFELVHDQRKPALECFEKALQLKLSAHNRLVAVYFKGACLDILGDREGALEAYGVVSNESSDPKLKKKALRRIKKPYQASYCQKISPDLQFVEPIFYL